MTPQPEQLCLGPWASCALHPAGPGPDWSSPAGLTASPPQNNRGREVGPRVAVISILQMRRQRPLASILGPPHSISNTVLTVIKKKNPKNKYRAIVPCLKFPQWLPDVRAGFRNFFLQRTGGKYCRFFGPRDIN